MKFTRLLLTILVLLSFVQLAYALTASIQPPRLIFRVNVTPSQITTIESYFTVSNYNDVPISVNASAEKGLAEIDQDDLSFSLDVDEQRQLDFIIQLSQPGEYSEGIPVLFSAEQGLPVSLSGEIIIHASEGDNPEENDYPPTQPDLVSPQDDDSFHDSQTTLQWDASSDPDGNTLSYEYYVDDDNDFSSPEFHDSTPNLEKEISGLGLETYYWKVVASDGEFDTPSDVWQFTVTNQDPSAPVLSGPLSGIILNEYPLLSWSAAEDPDEDPLSYNLIIDNDDDFSSPEVSGELDKTFYDITEQNLAKGTYFWKVNANDGFAESEYSDVWNFNLNITSICGDGTCNEDESCSNCPDDCGACRSSGGGGGGGGTPACTESWSCTTWSICLEGGIQTRTCTDKNNCGTTDNKPDEEKSCTYFPPTDSVVKEVEETPEEKPTMLETQPESTKEEEKAKSAEITGATIGVPPKGSPIIGVGITLLIVVVSIGIFIKRETIKLKKIWG